MAVVAADVLTSIEVYIPFENQLTSAQITALIDMVILQVGAADENKPEIMCKSLLAIGQVNQARASTVSSGVRRERTDELEQEFFAGSQGTQAWQSYIDSLSNICPLFGYTELTGVGSGRRGGMLITPGEAPCINPMPDHIKGYDY